MSDNEMRAEREFSDDERRLYELMSEISEDCYFAGWMSGNEHALWDAITTGDLRYGQGDMDRELLAQVAALSVKTGRWIIWRDDHDGLDPHDSSEWGPYSITIADWLARRSIPQGDEQPPLPEKRIGELWMEVMYINHATKRQVAFARLIEKEVSAACRAGRAKGEEPKWGAVHTVGDMVRNLLTLDQAAPIFTAFHVTIDGERRCRTRGITISRERVIDGKWIDSSRKDVPYANVIWAKPDERDNGEAKGEDARDDDADNLSVMLWLLRRLPRAYENPPHIVQAIERLAERTGTDVSDSFSERRAAATTPEGKGE